MHDLVIKVCSPSFSQQPVLNRELQELSGNVYINEAGYRYAGDELVDYLADADVAVIGTERLDRSIIERLPRLKFVAKYGVGTDNVDQEFLQQSGIGFGWQGGVNKRSVSEMTLCFMIGMLRNIFLTSSQLKTGNWNKNGGRQLSASTIGIIGCGFVGSDLVDMLAPFGCRILINDILDKTEFVKIKSKQGFDIAIAPLDDLLVQSDIVSLHVPLTPQTSQLVDAAFLAKMKKNAFIINTSRGRVVDQAALKSALMKNAIAGAALDVFQEEPPTDLELLGLPNLVATPHIGGNAQEAVLAMGRSAIYGIRQYLKEQAVVSV